MGNCNAAQKKRKLSSEVLLHISELKRAFESGELDENTVFNMGEAHFVINMDNKKTLGFRGDTTIRYHDVVSGGEGMTLVLKIRGGPCARIEPPMLIFQNQKSSYPIQKVPDDVPGVTYRSGPKGWMDQRLFRTWLRNKICNRCHHRDQKQVVYMDNASGHKVDECDDVLEAKK